MENIRIFLADSHVLLREGIRAIFESQTRFIVVGEAGNGPEAIEKIRREKPDIVIFDIGHPKMNGLLVIQQIHQEFPKAKILVLTMHSHEEYVFDAVKKGVSGYLIKDVPSSELIRAVEMISKGEPYFSPTISDFMTKECMKKSRRRTKTHLGIPLTEREQEVLLLIAEGLTNKNIAKKLILSVKTIDTHRSNLMTKLGIHETAGLVRFAVARGFIDLKKRKKGGR